MTLHNGKVHRLEAGVPGCPQISHLSMQVACERFLARRGLGSASFRKNSWLFGHKTAKRRAAA
jgi:uncharacterized protein YbjT (DUF2867 family)